MTENPLERFPLAYCETCKCDRPWQLVVAEADTSHAHAAANLVCAKCKTVIARLSEAPSLLSQIGNRLRRLISPLFRKDAD